MALRGALNHRKTRKLARLLDMPAACALGVMEGLWHITAAQAPTGAIGRLSNEEIADQLGFPLEDGDRLVAQIHDAGFLDEHALHRWIVHDWHQHSDNTLDAQLYRRGERYANGSIPRGVKIGKDEKAQLYERFYKKPPETLFDLPATPAVPNNVVSIAAAADPPEPPAPDGAAKRLPVPEPVPVPVPVTPIPPALSRRGLRRELAARVEAAKSTREGAALDKSAAYVLERSSISGVRAVAVGISIWIAIEAECKRLGRSAEDEAMEVAKVMATNYAEYVRDGPLMRFTWSPQTFFEMGHWRNWQAWPIDHDRERQQGGANVGRYVH